MEIIPAYTAESSFITCFNSDNIRSIKKANITIRFSFIIIRFTLPSSNTFSYSSHTSFLFFLTSLSRKESSPTPSTCVA